MSGWACNDGMSDDEVLSSPSPEPTPVPAPVPSQCSLSPSYREQFYTDSCGDRPYVMNTRPSRAGSVSPPPVSEVTPETENTYNIETPYKKRDYKYYMEPRIIVDYTTDIGSERESGSKRDYISSREVFGHISLGGRLPRDLMKILDNNISDKILNSFNGTEDELKEFTTFYWKKETTSSRYNINFVASPYDARMFLTRNYDIILGECTKAFLKYNDQVIY